MNLYDILLGICFLIGGVFLMLTDNLGTFDWSSVIGSMLITIALVDVAHRTWNGWLVYKEAFETN